MSPFLPILATQNIRLLLQRDRAKLYEVSKYVEALSAIPTFQNKSGYKDLKTSSDRVLRRCFSVFATFRSGSMNKKKRLFTLLIIQTCVMSLNYVMH